MSPVIFLFNKFVLQTKYLEISQKNLNCSMQSLWKVYVIIYMSEYGIWQWLSLVRTYAGSVKWLEWAKVMIFFKRRDHSSWWWNDKNAIGCKDKGDFLFFTIEVISTEVNYPWYKNLTARLDYTWNSNTFEPPNLTEHHDEYLKMNSY